MLLPVKTLSSSSMFRSGSLITVMSFAMWLAMLTSVFVVVVVVLFCFVFISTLYITFTCLSLLYVFMKKSTNQCTAYECYSSLLSRVSVLPVPWALGLEDEIPLSEAHPPFFYETP